MPRAFTIFVALLCLATTSACERISRTRQCRALISRVNPKLDEIEAGIAKPDKASYTASATRYEALASELGPLEFSSADMARDVAEYAALMRETAKQLREAAKVSEDPQKLEPIRNQLSQLAVRERMSIAKMDAWCHPH